MHRELARRVALGALLGSLTAAAPALGSVASVRFADPALPALAGQIADGGALRVEAVPLFPGEPGAVLELRRFRVYAPGARIVVHGAAGVRVLPTPERADFRGAVVGEPGSLAFLRIGAPGVGEEGEASEVRGVVSARRRAFEIAADPAAGTPGPGWVIRPAADGTLPEGIAVPDSCAASSLPEISPLPRESPSAPTPTPPPSPTALGGSTLRAAEVAIETDWELFQRLGSAAGIAAHVGDLLGILSTVYERDIGTALRVHYLSIWETPDDPFAVTSGLLDALYELGDYWHVQHTGTPRTITHLVSGRSGLTGGIAYHGVLCQSDAPVGGHWGGGYSLSGNVGALGIVRDSFIMAHEIGHNFRSHHTHCYNDLPTPGAPPIDHCRSGEIRNDGNPCYSGTVSMPPDGGSIMSYCYLLAGGYDNITMSFGAPGAFGEQSERVIQRMTAHVQLASCLTLLDGIFADGFESGDTTGWAGQGP